VKTGIGVVMLLVLMFAAFPIHPRKSQAMPPAILSNSSTVPSTLSTTTSAPSTLP
jgi:hypothetical protein